MPQLTLWIQKRRQNIYATRRRIMLGKNAAVEQYDIKDIHTRIREIDVNLERLEKIKMLEEIKRNLAD